MNVQSSAPPFLTIWRSFLRLRWVFHQRHHHWRSFEEASLAIGECAIIGTTILDHLKKFSSPLVKVSSSLPSLKIIWRIYLRLRWVFHQRHHDWRSFEEAFLAIGECAIIGPTIPDHLKKFSSPSRQTTLGNTTVNPMMNFSFRHFSHEPFFIFEGDIFRDLNRSLHFSPLSFIETGEVDHAVFVCFRRPVINCSSKHTNDPCSYITKSDILNSYRKNKSMWYLGVTRHNMRSSLPMMPELIA